MGAKVPVSNFAWTGERGSRQRNTSKLPLCTSCEFVELNVQPDHVHLVELIPPKLAISDLLCRLKGQTSMKLFQQFRHSKKKPYWGNHFWAKGHCVDSVGLDADMIRKYVRFQEKKEQQMEQLQLGD
jgi:putative transposase